MGNGMQDTARPMCSPKITPPSTASGNTDCLSDLDSMGHQLQRSTAVLRGPLKLCLVLSGPICPRITSKYIKNKIPLNAACLETGLTFPVASISEVQGNSLAVTNLSQGFPRSRMISCVPELLVISWWFLESHRSLLFTQLFAVLPNYDVLGMKYALGF